MGTVTLAILASDWVTTVIHLMINQPIIIIILPTYFYSADSFCIPFSEQTFTK